MSFKAPPNTEALHEYVVAHSAPLDGVALDLIEETLAGQPAEAMMQIDPIQVGMLTFLTKLVGARQAVEVGTFTGMSSLAIARGLPTDGRLTCFDISEDFTSMARRYWERAGVADRIELRIGPAAEGLRELPAEPYLDLVFIDADKASYPIYWAELVPRVRPGGLLAVDNVLRHGRVLAPENPDDHIIAAFNNDIMADDRVDVVMLAIADGLTLARRR